MTDFIQKGSSILVPVDQVEFNTDYVCSGLDNVVDPYGNSECSTWPTFNTDHDGFVGFQAPPPTNVSIDGETFYSYVPRRQRFTRSLEDMSNRYPRTFLVQVQEDQPKIFFPPILSGEVVMFDSNYVQINPPTFEEVSNGGVKHIALFNGEAYSGGQAFQDNQHQFNFIWSRKEDELWLEVRRLLEPPVQGETYFHVIIKSGECVHIDSHYFNFDNEGYENRLSGNQRAPLAVLDGQKQKFYHFSSTPGKTIAVADAISLVGDFHDDPRVDEYLHDLRSLE